MSLVLLVIALIAPSGAMFPELGAELADVEPPVRALIEQRASALSDSPDDAEAWGRLGMALDIHDFDARAEQCYRRANELAPESFPWAYYRALVLVEIGDPGSAEAFDKALELRPGFSPLLVRYGDHLLELGRSGEAERRYRQALEADGDGLSHALLGLARLALAAGDLENARGHAEQATAADPSFGPAHGLLAEIYRRQGEDRRAGESRRLLEESRGPAILVDEVLAELIDQGVSSYWRHERGQFLLASRQPRRAEDEFRAALEITPHALFHESLARALLVQKRHDEAEAALHKALEHAPDLASSHLLLGRLYARTERSSEAITALRRAAELRPDSPAPRELGQQLMATGERFEGIQWLEKSLELDEDRRVLLSVTFFYATTPDEEHRDPAKAERYARRLLELAPDRAEAWDVLGASLAAQGRFEEAISAAEKAFELAQGFGSPLVLRMRQRLQLYRDGRPFIATR